MLPIALAGDAQLDVVLTSIGAALTLMKAGPARSIELTRN